MPLPFQIPEDVACIHPYVMTATASVAIAICVYLVKRLKEKEGELKESFLNHIKDIKDQHQNSYDIHDKKNNFVLQTLENQITKLDLKSKTENKNV